MAAYFFLRKDIFLKNMLPYIKQQRDKFQFKKIILFAIEKQAINYLNL